MAANPLRCAQSLVGPARRGWTPEEAARYEVALLRGLASDKKAQRVFLRKVRVVELVRAGGKPDATRLGAHTKPLDKTAAVAGGHSSMPGQPLGTAAEPRARRRKSEAQRQKSVEKLQHKKLQSRCEAAATKVGGSPPNVLARVLACCGRFLELLHPDGAARMKRLRQAEEALSKVDAVDKGLNAMRSALASAAAPTSRMDVEKGQTLFAGAAGGRSSQPPPVWVHRPRRSEQPWSGREPCNRMEEPFVCGQASDVSGVAGHRRDEQARSYRDRVRDRQHGARLEGWYEWAVGFQGLWADL